MMIKYQKAFKVAVRDVAYASPGELESMGMACLKK
jgi:hypothetical protein